MKIYLTIFGKPRYLGLARIDDKVYEANKNFFEGHNKNRWVVLKTPRGIELGVLGGRLSPEQEEQYKAATSSFEESLEAMLQEVEFLKIADEYKIAMYYQCRREEEKALFRSRELLTVHELQLKLVDVEYMLDKKKLFFYFTSEQRVDFRAYVRDLAHEFRTRIEMRQIGIRDEARIVRGIASCGRPCCCSYWLRGFSPIGIKMVKEQKLALNPTKISGLCGRLMCCMSYEQSLYSELWAKLPGPGAKIKTEQGNYILESLDIGREYVHIRFPSGRLVSIAISEFPDFQEAVLSGKEWEDENTPPKPVTSTRPVRVLRGARTPVQEAKNNLPKIQDKKIMTNSDSQSKNKNEKSEKSEKIKSKTKRKSKNKENNKDNNK